MFHITSSSNIHIEDFTPNVALTDTVRSSNTPSLEKNCRLLEIIDPPSLDSRALFLFTEGTTNGPN